MSGHSAAKAQGDVAGVLRLVAYIGLAVALMVLDRRFDALQGIRGAAARVVEPVLVVAELPARSARWLRYVVVDREALAAENETLRQSLLRSSQQAVALQAELDQLKRQEQLLRQAPATMDARLVRIIEVHLGSSRARVLVDRGSRDGVRVGDAALDAFGLYGQVIRVGHAQAEVLMLSDPDHAVPVQVDRSGLRAVAQGSGLDAPLRIDSLPLTADIRSGDSLRASGLGGRFPTGFPVGTVIRVTREDGAAFLSAEIEPAARLTASRELLLMHLPLVTVDLSGGSAEAARPEAADPEAADAQ